MTSKYPSIIHKKGRPPWGYSRDRFDPHLYHPKERHLDALLYVLPYVKRGQISLRKASQWITAETGDYLSHKTISAYLRKYKKNREFYAENAASS